MPPDAPQESAEVDALELLDGALGGDRVAYARLVRLVAGYLTRWRADDFRADWDDIIQEVLLAAVTARREGRIPNGYALRAFLRQTARFKFVDRIRRQVRRPTTSLAESHSDTTGEETLEICWPPGDSLERQAMDLKLMVHEALERLDDRERAAVIEVYLRGHTYPRAAEVTGIPLGTLKRALRTGLATLREVLRDSRD